MTLDIRDAGANLDRDSGRVVAHVFLPGESTPGSTSRTEGVIDRATALDPAQLAADAAQILAEFGPRHPDLPALLRHNAAMVGVADSAGDDLVIVLGAAFTAEFAVEGAALCNPSAVPDPDQSGLGAGELRVILALRSIGEGHVSSIQFITAIIGADRTWRFSDRRMPLIRGAITDGEWRSEHLQRALEHDGRMSEIARAVLQQLPDRFTTPAIETAIRSLPAAFLTHPDARGRIEAIRLAGRSAYRAAFPLDSDPSQRVLMPAADEERHGMEDARFVAFVGDDGATDYRATYTAYDGRSITSRLIVTTDFCEFSIHRLTGPPARTKGMALFPRMVGGAHLALSRGDGERIFVTRSPDGLDWSVETLVYGPGTAAELVQTGNCGSPIETDRGWLVLTHGVGPMRRYTIGAILLDLDDPTIVIGRLVEPLLVPSGSRAPGYVPNVVYTCGGLVHDGVLWIPHGVGDQRIAVASVPLVDVLDAMA